MSDPELSAQFMVARELRCTIASLQTMSVDEFVHWLAYLKHADRRS